MKTLTKKTYSLPADVVAEFERHTAPGKRGVAVAEALRHWTQEKKRQELRALILEGLADEENEALYREVEREWSPVSDELWRAIDDDLWEWDAAPAQATGAQQPVVQPEAPREPQHERIAA